MLNFEYCSPTQFVFGRDVETQAGRRAKALGASKVLLHYGSGSAVRSGLIARVRESLEGAGLQVVELGGVRPNPRSGLVYQGIELCRAQGVDFILAVGGGSAIDSAKAIALGVPYEGDFWDFYCKKAVPQSALPLGVVLTMAVLLIFFGDIKASLIVGSSMPISLLATVILMAVCGFISIFFGKNARRRQKA